MSIEPIEVITDPDRFAYFVNTLVVENRGTQIGATKPTGFYLWDGNVYGVSIAFKEARVYDLKTFVENVKAGGLPGFIPFNWIDRLFR